MSEILKTPSGGGKVIVEGLDSTKILQGTTVTVKQGNKIIEKCIGTFIDNGKIAYAFVFVQDGSNYILSGTQITQDYWSYPNILQKDIKVNVPAIVSADTPADLIVLYISGCQCTPQGSGMYLQKGVKFSTRDYQNLTFYISSPGALVLGVPT